MRPSIVVVGSLNMDFVVSVERHPSPGETVLGRDFQMIPGGKGANQACASAKAGANSVDVKMIGRTGLDLFADHLKASLSAAGVNVSAVHSSRGNATGVALIGVDRAGENTIVVAPGANADLAAADVEAMRRVFQGGRVALFQLETPLATVSAAMKVAREEGLTTMLDPAPAQPLPQALLAHVDILTPNESEALILLGRTPRRVSLEEAPEIAQQVRSLGVPAVILKMGGLGCYYLGPDGARHVPGFRVEVRDATAAGDTFNGAFAVALAEGKPAAEALRFANAAAAISVTRVGAQASIPSRGEVDHFLASIM
jgi:ribokinase